MSDKSLRAVAALTGLALAVVIAVGAIVGSHTVAVDLQGRAEQAVVAAGLDGVDVQVSGREAELRGGTTVDRREAGAIVGAVHGVRSVRGGADVVARAPLRRDSAPAGGVGVVLTRTPDGLRIRGTVPTADASADIKAAAAAAFGTRLRGDLTVDPAAGRAAWVDTLPGLLGHLVEVRSLVLDIEGGRTVEIAGDVASPELRQEILHEISLALPGLDVTDRLTVGEV